MTRRVDAPSMPTPDLIDVLPRRSVVFASVVMPVGERSGDLVGLYHECAAALDAARRTFEFLFVLEPGFLPASGALKQLAASDSRVRVLVAGQGLGDAELLRAAIGYCTGEIVVTLPAYPRVQFSSLPTLLDHVAAGGDLVTAIRWPRRDAWINRLQSRVFHWLARPAMGRRFRDLGCGVHVIRRDVLEQLPLYGDFLRFLPILTMREGYRVEELPVPQHAKDRHARIYRPGVYVRRLIDMLGLFFLVRFNEKPLRFFGLVGSTVSFLGAIVLVVLLVQRVQGKGIADRPLLLLGVVLVVMGVQAVALGLVGEIIVHFSAGRRRTYRLAPPPTVPPGDK